MKTFLRVFLIILFLFLTVVFNVGLVDIRFQEVNYLLGKVAVQEDVSKAMGIVAKYELIKRRITHGEDDLENYELEAQIQAFTSGDQFSSEKESRKRAFYNLPVRAVLNGIRLFLGKNIINPKEENKVFHVIEIGYFWERTRKYQEAIKIYNEILDKTDLEPDLRAAILLHKGFCHSMLNEYDNTKQVYERVINQYSETEAGVIAWKLLDFITTIEEKRESVKERQMSDFEKARQYYLLMDYRNAIKHFSVFMQEAGSSAREIEALFYKGRSHEELGEIDEAVDAYKKVIADDKSRRWAKEANRRMIMLGDFYEQKSQIAETARNQLETYQDEGFMGRVEQFASMVSPSSIKNELVKDIGEQKAKPRKPDEDFMKLINEIGDLDLTGEKEQKAKEEQYRKMLLDNKDLTKAQVQEIVRKITLREHPFRRPTFLKGVIDENSSQIKYLYNKKLRKGIKISGKMNIEIKIMPDGRVRSAKVTNSNLGDSQFEQEVSERILSWRFKPVADSLGDLTINYPFEFFEEQ